MKLSQWAKKNNVSYQTAHNMFKAGKIPGARQLQTGTIVIDDLPVTSCEVTDKQTGRKFMVQLDVDLNTNGLTGADQRDIIDEINRLADLIVEKLKFGVIYKRWTP